MPVTPSLECDVLSVGSWSGVSLDPGSDAFESLGTVQLMWVLGGAWAGPEGGCGRNTDHHQPPSSKATALASAPCNALSTGRQRRRRETKGRSPEVWVLVSAWPSRPCAVGSHRIPLTQLRQKGEKVGLRRVGLQRQRSCVLSEGPHVQGGLPPRREDSSVRDYNQ